jgi:uncharacterized protein
MLELRPSCEHCQCELAPNSTEAMICSYECTFCKTCVETLLENVCPNCGGGFCPRPIRPQQNLKNNNCLSYDPASSVHKHKPVDAAEHARFAAAIKHIAPQNR